MKPGGHIPSSALTLEYSGKVVELVMVEINTLRTDTAKRIKLEAVCR